MGLYNDRLTLNQRIAILAEDCRAIENEYDGINIQIEIVVDQITILIENIETMKKPGIVVLASEYKRAVQELASARLAYSDLMQVFHATNTKLKIKRAEYANIVGASNQLRLVTGIVLKFPTKGKDNGQK